MGADGQDSREVQVVLARCMQVLGNRGNLLNCFLLPVGWFFVMRQCRSSVINGSVAQVSLAWRLLPGFRI